MGSVNRDYGLSHFNVTNAHNDWRIIIMKKYLNSIRSNKKGFTLIEMLLVLFIIAVLLLLILPNMNAQKGKVQEQGDQALLKTYESQTALYQMQNDTSETPSIDELLAEKYLSPEQAKRLKNIAP